MNRFLAGTCVFVFAFFAFGSAYAQEFNGFYVGGNAGVVSGRISPQTTPIFSPTGYFASTSTPAIATASAAQHFDPDRLTAGGQVGFTHQWDSFVFGIEADFGTLSSSKTSSTTVTYPCCSPTAFTITQATETSKLFTLRPRFGVAFGKVFLYGTAGPAFSHIKYSALFTDTFATAHESASFDASTLGWAVGAGSEFKIAKHLSVKGEYLRLGFGDQTLSQNLTAFTPAIAFPSNVFTHSVDVNLDVVRAGVNFRF
ncbi:MAG: outer membrane beta-barrel protein [Acidobacteriia bacterium]|nr:outer membrane beta-barrel protein [Terriglobia bacterium]